MMGPKERNKQKRYLRIRAMWEIMSSEYHLKTDFCFKAMCDFFAVEERTIQVALQEELPAICDFEEWELDRVWIEGYIKKHVFGKKGKTKERKAQLSLL